MTLIMLGLKKQLNKKKRNAAADDIIFTKKTNR